MQMKALFIVLFGVLFVKGTPFHPDSSIDLLKLNEVQEELGFNLNATTEVHGKPEENSHFNESNIAESAVTSEPINFKEQHNHSHHGHDGQDNFHHGHGDEHASTNMGPVELGLRNVVSASGIATEELFMEMAVLSSETSEMINTKSEILTSHAMNEIFKSLSMAEAEIKKNQECGRQFVNSFNAILGQVDSNLKTCVHNMSVIGENYRNQSTQILSSLSTVSVEIQNLPESCEIGENFAVGTFCTVNNLAEINTRVVMIVKDMRFITAVAKENISKSSSSTIACHKQLVQVVLEKLTNLFNEVGEKCKQVNKPQNNEI